MKFYLFRGSVIIKPKSRRGQRIMIVSEGGEPIIKCGFFGATWTQKEINRFISNKEAIEISAHELFNLKVDNFRFNS